MGLLDSDQLGTDDKKRNSNYLSTLALRSAPLECDKQKDSDDARQLCAADDDFLRSGAQTTQYRGGVVGLDKTPMKCALWSERADSDSSDRLYALIR